MTSCPVCGNNSCSSHLSQVEIPPGKQYDCPRCGQFTLCGTLADGFPGTFLDGHRRAVLSYRLRTMQGSKSVSLVADELQSLRLDDPLPSPPEQVDRLVIWVGDHQCSPGRSTEVPVPAIEAWIGAQIATNDGSELSWLLSQDKVKSKIDKGAQLD